MSKFSADAIRRESPVERLEEPEHWAPPAAVDHEVLLADARRERDKALAAALGKGAKAVAALWRRAVAQPFARWRERERTIRELSLLREHELAELGIAPGMIRYIASGKFRTDDGAGVSGAAAANENARTRRVA